MRRRFRTDPDGRTVEVRDRRRRTKLTRVYLFAAQPDNGARFTEHELTFLLGADRRAWPTIVERSRRPDFFIVFRPTPARLGRARTSPTRPR